MEEKELTCDRCGNKYKENPFRFTAFSLNGFDANENLIVSPHYRLCPKCIDEFGEWFNEGKKNALS